MIKNLRHILLFCLCLLWSCTEELVMDSSVEAVLPVSFSSVPMQMSGPESKSISEEIQEGVGKDYVVSDVWVLQYNMNGLLVGKPSYYRTESGEDLSISILKPSDPDVYYRTVFLANIHDNAFLTKIGDYSTLSALKALGYTVDSSSQLYQEGYNDLTRSGFVDVSSDTDEISCQLYRNVAKLIVSIDNKESSPIKINSVQLVNVSNKLFYADHLFDGDDRGGEVPVPSPSEVSFVKYELDALSLEPGDKSSLTYYVPRNMRGVNSSQSPKDKNLAPPAYATYIEVLATHKERNTPVQYHFYLGRNNTNDFNVEPNWLYEVNLTFNDMGADDDSRMKDLGEVVLGDANSYIIKPDVTKLGTKYTIPAAPRVNKFWESEIGKIADGIESTVKYSDYLIDGNNEWVAELIWQDIKVPDAAPLIEFVPNDKDDTSFSFFLTDAVEGLQGNLLIGVRNAKADWSPEVDGYMWSWHIWLTDYDPDPKHVDAWSEDRYHYPIPAASGGGSLHSYPSFSTELDGLYRGRFIMDRNLGALSADAPAVGSTDAERRAQVRKAIGLCYEFGRKDPFPRNMYDAESKLLSFTTTEGPGAIFASVIKPRNYYIGETADWVGNNSLRSYDWNDLDKIAYEGSDKSFFDPCPPGWKVPHESIFNCYGDEKFVYAWNWNKSHSPDWGDTSKNEFTEYGGWLVYLSGQDGWNTGTGDLVYFPAGGFRTYSDGKIGNELSIGALWTVTPDRRPEGKIDQGNYLYTSNSLSSNGLLFSHPRAFHRYLGMPVRCIQDTQE